MPVFGQKVTTIPFKGIHLYLITHASIVQICENNGVGKLWHVEQLYCLQKGNWKVLYRFLYLPFSKFMN